MISTSSQPINWCATQHHIHMCTNCYIMAFVWFHLCHADDQRVTTGPMPYTLIIVSCVTTYNRLCIAERFQETSILL